MIDALLDQMTLEEQVSLLAGADFWTTVPIERLGIPKIKVTDGPNGARGGGSLVGGIKSACFPCAISVGSTWSPDLVRQMGVALAEEAKTKSARVLLAPTVNMHRTGLNGRNFECYSEDPVLTAELAVAYVEGVQSQGVAATMKHYVGNESEIERYTMSTDVDERTLREIYLLPFEAAVKRADLWAIMSSYNRLNGTYTADHPWLLTEVLRKDWGFDGLVMSDWFGSRTTAESVNAGLDLEMPGPTRDRGQKLVDAVKAGQVSPATIRERARTVLLLLERVGAFADPTMREETAVDRPEHRALIRKMGAEGTVLLKNDGILPLSKTGLDKVVVLGPNAAEARVMGGGSAMINAHYRVSPLDGLKAAMKGSNVIIHARAVGNDRLVARIATPVEIEVFDTVDFTGPVVHRTTQPFSEVFWGDPPAGTTTGEYSARLKVAYRPDADGDHVLGLASAGLAKLYVDGDLVLNGWDGWKIGNTNFFCKGSDEIRAIRSFEAGRTYEILVEFRSRSADDMDFSAVRFGIELPLGDADIAGAVEEAKDAGVAIIYAGRNGEWDSEGADLADFDLPGRQNELISAVAAVNPKTVVVLQTGGPVMMPWLDKVAAVLQVWYPGQEVGNAVADVLFGDAEPGGRLPQTFPKRPRDVSALTGDAATYPGKDGHVVYKEGVFIGYRHHDRADTGTLFPFGYGLSYTTFSWGSPRLSQPEMDEGGIHVSVPVTNTGARAGSDVVQVYVRCPHASVPRPEKELRGFMKLELAAGATGTAVIKLSPRDLAYYDVARAGWVALPGTYEAVVAASAEDVRSVQRFTLAEEWFEPVRG